MDQKIERFSKKYICECFDKNASRYENLNRFMPVIFHELIYYTNEITNCLIIEANTAAITLTNYLLERLLKLALVEDTMKLLPTAHPWKDSWERIHPFLGLFLEDTINRCRTAQLISREQKRDLLKFKTKFRNGFSHASTDEIFKDLPETYNVEYGAPFYDSVTFNLKKDPRFQFKFLINIANKHAEEYFFYVFNLIEEIEINLQKKYPGNLITKVSSNGTNIRVVAKGWRPTLPTLTIEYDNPFPHAKIIEDLINSCKSTYEISKTRESIFYKITFSEILMRDNFVKSYYTLTGERLDENNIE